MDTSKKNQNTKMTTEDIEGAYAYAKGATRRLAEQMSVNTSRHYNLKGYTSLPERQSVIDDMIGNGWSETESQAAVEQLWEDLWGTN